MPIEFFISALVTLLVVVDPVGLAPGFLAVTHGLSIAHRRQVAVRATVIAATILFGVALGGDWLLRQLGITLPAFRTAGGLLLFYIAAEMVFGVRIARQTEAAEQAIEEHVRYIAAFPLAIPLMAGPGAITATVLLAGQVPHGSVAFVILLGVIAVAMLCCLIAFLLAERIAALLGVTGNVVLSRLLGVILAALAVQYVIDGIRAAIAA